MFELLKQRMDLSKEKSKHKLATSKFNQGISLLAIKVKFLFSSGMEAELEMEFLGGSQSFCNIRQNLGIQTVSLSSVSYNQANRKRGKNKLQGRLESPKHFEQIFC